MNLQLEIFLKSRVYCNHFRDLLSNFETKLKQMSTLSTKIHSIHIFLSLFFCSISKRNLYKDVPERSGGSIIVCNKCRAMKNSFWKKKEFLLNRFFAIWYLFWNYFYFEKIIYDYKRHALKKNGNNMLLHSNSSFLVTFITHSSERKQLTPTTKQAIKTIKSL